MPEFVLDSSGVVTMCPPAQPAFAYLTWRDLDSFAQGYIEALFFTDNAPNVSTEQWQATDSHDEGSIPGDVGFSDLAPETLQEMLNDCRAFKETPAWKAFEESDDADESQCGRDFWYTRNGHGCGYWDGDYPEPHATALSDAADKFSQADSYLGDDGKVYLS